MSLSFVVLAIVANSSLTTPCADAQRWFEEGLRESSGRRMAKAIVLYRRAHAACPRVATAFNLASAHLLVGEPVEASTLFERLANGAYGGLTDEQAHVVRRLLESALRERATLIVATRGSRNHAIVIDGAQHSRGAAREISVVVNAGTHSVQILAADGMQRQTSVEVEAGQSRRIDLTLPPSLVELTVASSDPDLPLEIVGRAQGSGQITARVSPGAYRVRAPTLDQERTILVHPERPVRVEFEDNSSILTSTWFWVGIAAVAAATATSIAIVHSQRPTVEESPEWGRISAFGDY